MYGTGLKGAERERLSLPENSDIRNRIAFYVDEGQGVFPEAGVGSVRHDVRLDNLYNIGEDPEGLRSDNRNDPSAMERAIVQAGYDGYYSPGGFGKQGAAVVIGDHMITPAAEKLPANPAPAARNADSFGARLSRSQLPGGRMKGKEWLVAISGTEFDVPAVRAQLEERPDELIYRDDLPRFNKGMKFSMDEEAATIHDPVTQPAPRELNILRRADNSASERLLEAMREKLQDKHITLRRIQNAAGIIAENLKMDTMGALDRLGSKLMTEQHRLAIDPLNRIEAVLRKAGYGEEEGRKALESLLIAKHVKEYNEHIAAINPAKYDADGKYISGYNLTDHPGSGKTAAAAAKEIKALMSDKRAEALREAEKIYRDSIKAIQDFAVERGLEKRETIDAWNEIFPNYTPFNRELDLEENMSVGTAPGQSGFSVRTGISRQAMGSSAEIVSPLASTMLLGLKTAARGENAVVTRTFLEFAKAYIPNYMTPGGELKPMWTVSKPKPVRAIKKVNVYQVEQKDGTRSLEFYSRAQAEAHKAVVGGEVVKVGNGPQSRVVVQEVPNYLNDPSVLVIPVNGENVVITFDLQSEDARNILENFKQGSKPSAALALPRLVSRWVMSTSTGFNPTFIIFNAARDVQAAALNAAGDKIPGWTAGDSAAIVKGMPEAIGSIWRQLGKEFRAVHDKGYEVPAPEKGSMAEWAEKMKTHGGATGVMQSISDLDDAETLIRRTFGQELLEKARVGQKEDWLTEANKVFAKVGDSVYRFGEGEIKAPAVKALSHATAGVARMNMAGELATRTLVFKRATELYMQAGKTEEEAMTLAANISKNVSTNFNRRGTETTWVNALFPFFNAAVQGTTKLAETLFEKNTYKVTVNGKVMIGQKTQLTPYGKKLITALGTAGVMQALLLLMAGFDDDDIPDNVKDRALIIPLSGKDYLAIPMPHGYNMLVNVGREMTDMAIQAAQGNSKKAAGHLGHASFGQMGIANPLGGAGNWVTDLSPAFLDVPFGLAMNQDAFGRPIAKEDMNPRAPTPGFTRAKEGASGLSRTVAEGLNYLSGGNEDQPGLFSPTPDQIDFVLGNIGGGVGRELMKTGGLLSAGVNELTGSAREPIPLNKVPVVGRLYGDVNEPAVMRSRLFEISKDLNVLHARYEGLRDRGEIEAAKEFRAAHPELKLRQQFETFARKDAKMRKQRAAARTGNDIAKVNAINERQDAKIEKLIEQYNEITQQ
jgi:hypothetical protein